MKIEKWFCTPIWFEHLEFDTKKIAKKCLQLRESGFPDRKFSNEGGWQSRDINLEEHYELIDVKKILDEKIIELSRTFSPNLELFLGNVWININEKGCRNVKHLHPGSALSGTIYIQTDNNTGNIVFFNDHSPMQHYTLQPGNNADLFQKKVTYHPKDGMIIFFPSWIPHLVQPSNSDLPRISISFNISQKIHGL